jgi:hypothetical protein
MITSSMLMKAVQGHSHQWRCRSTAMVMDVTFILPRTARSLLVLLTRQPSFARGAAGRSRISYGGPSPVGEAPASSPSDKARFTIVFSIIIIIINITIFSLSIFSVFYLLSGVVSFSE